MKTVMPIREAVENGFISMGGTINYVPDSREITLTREKTGMQEERQLLTTQNLCWRVVESFYNGLFLISTSEWRNNAVWLSGEEGFKNGPHILNETCKTLYSNKKLNLQAKNIDITLLEELVEFVEPRSTRYWVSTQYEQRKMFYWNRGLLQFSPKGIVKQKMYGGLVRISDVADVLPVIHIPESKKVDIFTKSFVED